MTNWTKERIRNLVQEDRVHRDIYSDPDLFEVEMEKIFSRLWVFVGHESQVKSPGDFVTATVARRPVVMCRDVTGKVQVLYNRCGHRGAKVVNEDCGRTRQFQCCYHGWSFNLDGSLAGVPLREDYPTNIDLNDPKYGMMPVPRVGNYRGFIFASLSSSGPSLEDYLGPAAEGIDELTERSPQGQLDFSGGRHRYFYRGNWKHQFENLADTYHPVAAHASTVGPDGRQFKRRPGAKGGRAPFFNDKGEPLVSLIGVFAYPYGHTSEGTMFAHDEPEGGEVWEQYRAQMNETYGKERARQLMNSSRHSITYFPSVDILMLQNSVRTVIPRAVDLTEVHVYPVRLVGAPESLNHDIVRFVNITHSASSFVQSDDLESFLRVQEGVDADGNPWCLTARGLGEERRDSNGVLWGDRSSEIGQRNQHEAWVGFMTAD